jgi:hypothetical protein
MQQIVRIPIGTADSRADTRFVRDRSAPQKQCGVSQPGNDKAFRCDRSN